MDLFRDYVRFETRRQFLASSLSVAGAAALSTLMEGDARGADPTKPGPAKTHHTPKAKSVIYLHMVGGPPQMDLYDYKPKMTDYFDKDLPDSIRMGQRLTTMTSGQARFPVAPSVFKFQQHGQNGAWVSELLPYTAEMVDD